MPKMMSMQDFLAGGGPAVKAYNNKGILPSYVSRPRTTRPKNAPTPSFSRLNKGSKGKRTSNAISAGAGAMKKRATPMKKKKKMPTKKRTMPKY